MAFAGQVHELSGVRVVRLHWSDELDPVGARVVELDVTRDARN